MIIKEAKGNLLDAFSHGNEMIVHGCNAKGVMGAGVALAIRKKWPQAYKDYREAWDWYTEKSYAGPFLGSVSFTKVDEGVVANAVTQNDFGTDGKRYMSYDALDKSMRTVALYAKRDGITRIGMSPIGSSLGGAPWTVSKQIINDVFFGTGIAVMVYHL